jgi:hypothetical protein
MGALHESAAGIDAESGGGERVAVSVELERGRVADKRCREHH